MEKLAYKPCDYCGEMIDEGEDPEAYRDNGEIVCLYCREDKNGNQN